MRRFALHSRRRAQAGLTLLELMIVIAIIGIGLFAVRSGVRGITKADLVEDADELAGMLRRASQLAIEHGEQHRVVFDLEKGVYRIDICQGQAALARGKTDVEGMDPDEDKTKQAIQKGQDRLRDLPADALAIGDPDEAVKRAKAIAGHHIADRVCTPAKEGVSGVNHNAKKVNLQVGGQDADWVRVLNVAAGNKFNEIWVQHKEGSTRKGEVAIYFWPSGTSEKAVIELGDSDDTVRTVLVHGLTGRITQKSGKLDDVDAHMLRNIFGKRERERETDR